jgi:hypothetical protein
VPTLGGVDTIRLPAIRRRDGLDLKPASRKMPSAYGERYSGSVWASER